MRSISLFTAARTAYALALVLAGVAASPVLSAAEAGADRVLAIVDGKPVTEADVRKSAAAEFEGLDREFAQRRYDLLQTQLMHQIELRLIAAEAAKRGMTDEALMASLAPPPISDADVDLFFQQNEQRLRGTKEQMAPQIREYLEQIAAQQTMKTFIDELRDKYTVDVKLEPLRIDVAATGPARGGPPNAPVTIVEFADFQCPYCVKLLPSIQQVLATYGDKVRFVYRHYPLSIHSDAQRAAEASMCADEQGKFWQMHDGMFANIRALAAEQLKTTAQGIGLDLEQYDACVASRKFAALIAADADAGNAAGVSGTPALFINGRMLAGAAPLEEITEVIEDELRRKGIRTASN